MSPYAQMRAERDTLQRRLTLALEHVADLQGRLREALGVPERHPPTLVGAIITDKRTGNQWIVRKPWSRTATPPTMGQVQRAIHNGELRMNGVGAYSVRVPSSYGGLERIHNIASVARVCKV